MRDSLKLVSLFSFLAISAVVVSLSGCGAVNTVRRDQFATKTEDIGLILSIDPMPNDVGGLYVKTSKTTVIVQGYPQIPISIEGKLITEGTNIYFSWVGCKKKYSVYRGYPGESDLE